MKIFAGGLLGGIAAAPDGTFVIRPRGGPGRTVVRFHPATNTFTKLFDLPDMRVRSDEIVVLPGGNLVLNWDNQLKIFSPAGQLLLEGREYEHTIVALTYSSFHKTLVALTYYSPSYHTSQVLSPPSGAIVLIDPHSLQITRVIPLTTEEGWVGLAVSPRGRFYVCLVKHGVYEVDGALIGEECLQGAWRGLTRRAENINLQTGGMGSNVAKMSPNRARNLRRSV